MADLNPTAAALLGLLHGDDASGYELWNAAREFIGDFWTVTRSQVYRELTALDGRGLIEAQAVGARSRRAYRITQEGRAAFAVWLPPPPPPHEIRYPLLPTPAI